MSRKPAYKQALSIGTAVVLGKYFAMLTVFAVPVAIACLCPLIIALNGTAFLLADYGAILAFFLGYSMMFFKGGILASIYPFSAALILVGFDMSEYAGTTTAPNSLLAVIGVGIMVLWAVLLLVMSSNKKEMKARKQTKAKGRGKRAIRRKGR